MVSKTIFTLGFQDLTLVDFIRLVKEQEVVRVVDIRGKRMIVDGRIPFSPKQLKSVLKNVDVDYIQMPEVEMPTQLENRSRGNGNRAEFIQEYVDIVSSDKSIVKKVNKYLSDDKVMLLCFEREADACKRRLFANLVVAILPDKIKIRNLSLKDLKPIVIPPPEQTGIR